MLRPLLTAAIAAGDEHVGDDGIVYGVGPRGIALGVGLGLAAFAGVEAGADLAEAAVTDLASQQGRALVRYRRAAAERRAAEERAAAERRAAEERAAERAAAGERAAERAAPGELAQVRAELAQLAALVGRLVGSGAAAPPAAVHHVPDELFPAFQSAESQQRGGS